MNSAPPSIVSFPHSAEFPSPRNSPLRHPHPAYCQLPSPVIRSLPHARPTPPSSPLPNSPGRASPHHHPPTLPINSRIPAELRPRDQPHPSLAPAESSPRLPIELARHPPCQFTHHPAEFIQLLVEFRPSSRKSPIPSSSQIPAKIREFESSRIHELMNSDSRRNSRSHEIHTIVSPQPPTFSNLGSSSSPF